LTVRDEPAERARRPAFYAASGGWLGDWWTLLHPPYTAWHLSYVLLGAAVAPRVDAVTLAATLAAFFLAVGVSAHALDELKGRPLGTRLTDTTLRVAAAVGLAGAVGIGAAGVALIGPGLLAFVVVGVLLVLGYNLELFGGRIHTDLGFALAWGAFPTLTSGWAQGVLLEPALWLVAGATAGLSWGQRQLSTPARHVRRRVHQVEVRLTGDDGGVDVTDEAWLLRPLERALRALSWSVVALAIGLVLPRL
jgi:hypothetical protein